MTPDGSGGRAAELRANLEAVRARIAAAAVAAGREPATVTLVAVSKTFPASDVALLHAAGQLEFGESRLQEALPKRAAVAAAQRPGGSSPRWHFLGHLQRNKAAAIGAAFDVVQSVDRIALLEPLASGAARRGSPLEVLVQVDLDGTDPNRSGAGPADVPALADAVAATPDLVLRGVMTVAPRGAVPAAAFAHLAEVAARVRADHPEATTVSAGMSADLEAAVAAGATLVRVGTAMFGGRTAHLG